ncbi:hypothetical protein OGAPHI_002896 [Ogataea philodendri]|uniref:Uncharacterized protein n=1 Tax=Ogataea philodendri TaxID=1378263 RepID=A0A9P8P8E4_9ASCO|nr:uncharacterized protein OGAPHI_002896 [Ogataea philodendri]KAH3667247.1 hypothetical protein OGAPHI_002896 [Ogataea philodendri]
MNHQVSSQIASLSVEGALLKSTSSSSSSTSASIESWFSFSSSLCFPVERIFVSLCTVVATSCRSTEGFGDILKSPLFNLRAGTVLREDRLLETFGDVGAVGQPLADVGGVSKPDSAGELP